MAPPRTDRVADRVDGASSGGDGLIGRRRALHTLAGSLLAAWSAPLAALAVSTPRQALADDDVVVPVDRQVALMVKVAGYDRNLARRAEGRVRTAVLAKGNAEATRTSSALMKALADQPTVGGISHETQLLGWSDAGALVQRVRAARLSIVYLTTGFGEDELGAIARALDGVDVLTVSAVPAFVPRGVVLGFDLVSGKPKLLVHLGQARRQNVSLSAEVLKLSRVYE